MLKTLLASAAVLTLMSGAGFAQSSYTSSTSTTQIAPTVPPRHDVNETSTTRRTVTPNGVMIEKDTSGDEVSSPGMPGGSVTTTHTTHTQD
jgi:hypothetical protein